VVSSPRTRLAAGVLAWLAAVGAALAVGLSAVGAIGAGLLGPGPEPLTPAEVDTRLASAEPGASAVLPPASTEPRAAASPSAPEVIATAGGTVLARCTGGSPEVVSATPAQGFRVQTEDDDGGPRVRFRAGDARFEIRLSCADGRPVADVESDD